jgi:hypothetical protein
MTAIRARIENLVTRIQSGFLANPTLALTLPAAEKRFGVDPSDVRRRAQCAGRVPSADRTRRRLSSVLSTTRRNARRLKHRCPRTGSWITPS